jgi:mRNA interferase RelE/StbE|tara:strand:+ start:22370 stop:22636 length:267 start_codon:yes stop_codon:yes gene_type:complete
VYKIKFDDRVIRKDSKRIPGKFWIKILYKIKTSLTDNPLFHSKPLKGNLKGLYCLRAGDYRIIFNLNRKKKSVLVLKVGHRSEIYKDL